jgi:hypothetical protein
LNRSGGSCDRFHLLVRLSGLPVIAVELGDDGGLRTVESSAWWWVAAPAVWSLTAHGRVEADGRVEVTLAEAPRAGPPVTVTWRRWRWVCPSRDAQTDPNVVDRAYWRPCNLMRRMVGGVK